MDPKPCLFCKIASGEIPAKLVFSDPHVVAFHDIHPGAPAHALVIPRVHLVSLEELEDDALGTALWRGVRRVAHELGIVESGYRTVVNTGAHAGQSVFHLHVHVLGGRALSWPPG
jgi:histidine triad (HIT) family protein